MNILVIKDNHIALQKAWGYAKKHEGSTPLADPIKATTNTMYDLASNTKCMQLILHCKCLRMKERLA